MQEPLEQRPSAVQLRRLLQVYASALRDNPSDLNLRTKLAEVLRLLGRAEEAIALYSSVAWAYGVSGNLGQAIMICKLILELNPKHSVTQEMLAKLYASKQIREQKQSVPVHQVGGRWVVDPRSPSDPNPGAPSGTAAVPDPSLRLDRPASARALVPPHGAESDWGFDDEPNASHTGPPEPSAAFEIRQPPGLAEAAALVRAGAAEPPGDPARRQRSEHITSCELPRRGPDEALAPEPQRTPSAEQRRHSGSGPHLEPIPLDRADSMSGLSIDEKRGQAATASRSVSSEQAPIFHKHLPTREELPASALEPTRIDGDALPPTAAPAAFVIRSGPSGQLELASRRETSLDDMRPTTRHDPVQRIPEAEPLPDAEAELAGGPDLAFPPAEEEPGPALEEPPPLPPVESLASVLEPLPGVPARALEEVTPSSEPDPTRSTLRTPTSPLPLSIEPSRPVESAPPPLASVAPSQPAASESAEPGEPPRRRRITEPGYVISGPLEGASSKHTKTTRRYASAERTPVSTTESAENPEEPAAPSPPAPPAPSAPTSAQQELEERTAVSVPEGLGAEQDPEPEPLPEPHGMVHPTVQMDSAAINSMLRRDAEEAFGERPAAVGYASIQREVLSACNEQAEAELLEEDSVRAERNLLDTIRETPMELEFEEGQARHVSPFPLFSDLDTPAFLAVVKRMDRRVCTAGTVICNEGDPGDSLYLVASGVLSVLKAVGGQQVQLARLGSGSFFGEFGLLTDGQRHASVRCLEECELLELRRDVLIELSHDHPTISWTLRTFYQQRVMSNVLATSPLFQAVSPEERKSVLARFAFRRFMAGEVIVREGKQGTGFYVILVGRAAVSCLAEDGSDVRLDVLSEGHYFGEMSLLSGCVAEATVRAERVTEVLVLEPQDFYDLAADHPEIWAAVQEEAERRRQDTAARLASKDREGGTGALCLI